MSTSSTRLLLQEDKQMNTTQTLAFKTAQVTNY